MQNSNLQVLYIILFLNAKNNEINRIKNDMKLKEVKFVKSVDINSKEVFFDEKPEIVFLGRSNVWKSSLMNAIFETKDLVKTSSVPGKTRTANLFLLNNKYYFTDLPWYGFAKMWKEKKQDIDSLISWYLEEKKWSIKTAIILIDSKLWPQESDEGMYRYLLELGFDITIAITKIDKVWNNNLKNTLIMCEKSFFWQAIHKVSSKSSIWIKEFRNLLFEKIVWQK